jgi:hypothetical protein
MSKLFRLSVGVFAASACWLLSAAPGGADEPAKTFPKGSEKAVKAVQEALPKVVIDAVEQPKGFGADPKGESPLFWAVRCHVGEDKQELSVTPDGVIVRLPQVVEVKALPDKVKDALTKAAGDAKVQKVEKQETRASLRYAALDKPEVVYSAEVAKGDKKMRVRVGADGTVLANTPIKEEKKEEPKPKEDAKPAGEKEAKDAPRADDKKKPKYPEEAAKAVKAVEKEFPDAEVTGVEIVGYSDGTGAMEVLNYEVEYTLKGVEHELNVTPEGVIIYLAVPVEVKDLPKAVADALAKEVPDGTVKSASKVETRAGLKFVALDKPKVLYVATLDDKGKTVVKLREDGSVVKDVNPFEKKDDAKDKPPAKP